MDNQITILSYGSANAYLVSGRTGSILIDTGTEQYRDKILEGCRKQSVKLIVLTHGHFDHCQNAAYLAEALGCPVGIGEADAALLEQGVKRKVYGRGIWGGIYAAASNWNIVHKKMTYLKPEVILQPDMPLSGYGVDGRVIALPGHTAGHVGVLLDSGYLFAGDAMQNIGKPALTWCCEDYESAVASVRRIEALGAAGIYYGHGKPEIIR